MKYLKTWMGYVTGSLMGRDDGQPEKKFSYYTSIDELAKDFGKKPREQYYELVELDQQSLKLSVVESLEKQNEKATEQKKEDIQMQIEALQNQLKDLSK